jgi:hypothetical protein
MIMEYDMFLLENGCEMQKRRREEDQRLPNACLAIRDTIVRETSCSSCLKNHIPNEKNINEFLGCRRDYTILLLSWIMLSERSSHDE